MGVIINNVAYSWAMIQLSAPGLGADSVTLTGVSAVSWNKQRSIGTNYGLGGKPVNRGFGNFTYSASITFDYNTYVTLLGANSSLMDLGEFDLTISFANAVDGSEFTTHTVTLKGCIFDQDAMSASQDDTNIKNEYNLNPFDIIILPETA